jgi:hypothetical protein
MSNLSVCFTPVKSTRYQVAIHATTLGRDLRAMLRGLGYSARGVADVVEFVGVNGTATGADLDPADADAINALVVRHTDCTEYESAADWPNVYDADSGYWTPDAPIPLPADAGPFTEPEPADRLWWFSLSDAADRLGLELGRAADEAESLALLVSGLAPICGGSPNLDHRAAESAATDAHCSGLTPADFKPVKSRRPRLAGSGVGDADVLLLTGSVG